VFVLQWPAVKKRTYEVNRRSSALEMWKPLVTDLKGFELIDASSDLIPGRVYQYQVAPYKTPGLVQHIEVAAYTPPKHNRGKVLLLVDQTHWRTLEDDLNHFVKICRWMDGKLSWRKLPGMWIPDGNPM
jgi:hypothetical protein